MVGGLAAAGFAGTATAACTSEPEGTAMEQPSGRTIIVGLIAPAVGAYGAIGDEITKGFKLFLKNTESRAGTHNVDLQVAEEGATAETAAAAARRLIEKGAIAVAGVANPAALSVVANATDEARIPLISATASPAAFTKSQAYTWRAAYVQGEAGRAIAPYAYREGARVYIMHEESAAGLEDANRFAEVFQELGGTVVATTSGKGSFGSRLQAARSQGANSVFAAYTGNDAAALLVAYRGTTLARDGIKLLGPSGLTETIDLAKLGALPEMVYTAGCYAPDLDNESNQRFVSSYHKEYGVQPTSFAMAGYDTISVLDKMLRLVEGDLTAVNVNRAASLLGRIDSPRGPWSFNVSRTPQQKWYLRKLRLDGQVPANLLDNDLAVLS